MEATSHPIYHRLKREVSFILRISHRCLATICSSGSVSSTAAVLIDIQSELKALQELIDGRISNHASKDIEDIIKEAKLASEDSGERLASTSWDKL